MKQFRVMAAGLVVSGCVSYTAASPSEDLFEWATINHAGNAGFDRPTINPFATGRGSVSYEYRVARNEVSSGQFLTFLNTFTTQSDDLATQIRAPLHWGGERDFSYSGPGVRYRLRDDVADAEHLPILGTSWRSAAYFINWMNNDLSSDPSAIQNGAYDASTFGGDRQSGYTDQSSRNAGARYFLPNYDEWIKAAHYDPDKNGPGSGGWWLFNNGSDTAPVAGPPGEGETSAGWLVDGSPAPAWETPLGSYPETTSPWGLMDVSGGGGDWTESWSFIDTTVHRRRLWQGAAAGDTGLPDSIDYPASADPNLVGFSLSFRVAAVVPSPTPCAFLVATMMIGFYKRRRDDFQ